MREGAGTTEEKYIGENEERLGSRDGRTAMAVLRAGHREDSRLEAVYLKRRYALCLKAPPMHYTNARSLNLAPDFTLTILQVQSSWH